MRRLLFTTFLLAVCPLVAVAQSAAAPAGAEVRESFQVDFTEETLPNGLRVIYHVDRSTPVAAVALWYDVGSKHEQPGRTGFAHLFEHIMFKGSRNVGDGQHFALLEAAGGRAGADINGTTNTDRTNYFQQVPSNMVELALWLEADRMGTLLDALDVGKLDNQREVVKNERRQGVDNQPYGLWNERMRTHVFPEGHPYRHPVIGYMDDLDAAQLEDVTSFFRTYYAPNNAVLVVAGDIEIDEVRAMVQRHFGWIPRGAQPPALRDATVPPRIGASPREVIQDANARAPAVYVGYRMPNAREPRAPAVNLLSTLIASGRSSPLYESLVRRQQLATNVFAFSFGHVDGADLMVVAVIGRPGIEADALESALLAELDGISAAVTDAALERARASSRFGLVNQLQGMGGFGGRADMLAMGATYHRDPNWVNGLLDRLDGVSTADLRALISERMTVDNRATIVFVPQTATPTPARP